MFAYGDNIFVVVSEKKQNKYTEGGLLLPSSKNDDDLVEAVVKTVGHKVEGVNPGDVIVFSKFSGLKYSGDKYFIKDANILGHLYRATPPV